ncbi:hypothetical protein HUG17_6336 [Dermatophagoides farinae]|uniref:Reverse transcriptase domain-containing protein n=1 Tax=Dermatophagoides farinae TaxID=6954 RepID=A0A9D4SIP4_DERFA|nr:hypothetical protein HUG17_6336 [Dermatophagoides farinae]
MYKARYIPGQMESIYRQSNPTICGESAEKLLSRGCPQGAKCSPLLWNILYDNLLKLHLPTGCYLQAVWFPKCLYVLHPALPKNQE